MAKPKKALNLVIISVVTLVVLAVIGAVLFIGVTLSSLNDSIAVKKAQVITAFSARDEAVLELTTLLEDKMSLDRDAFERLHVARKQLSDAVTDEEISAANIQVDEAIDNLIFVMKDKYLYLEGEDVKAVEKQIESANNRIVMETSDYNKDVLDYNLTAETFPGNVLVDILGLNQKEIVFEIIDINRG